MEGPGGQTRQGERLGSGGGEEAAGSARASLCGGGRVHQRTGRPTARPRACRAAMVAAASGRTVSAKAKRHGAWPARTNHSSEHPSSGGSATPQNAAEPSRAAPVTSRKDGPGGHCAAAAAARRAALLMRVILARALSAARSRRIHS